jgi:hypothetical protein
MPNLFCSSSQACTSTLAYLALFLAHECHLNPACAGHTGRATQGKRAGAACTKRSSTGDPLMRALQEPQWGESARAAGPPEGSQEAVQSRQPWKGSLPLTWGILRRGDIILHRQGTPQEPHDSLGCP